MLYLNILYGDLSFTLNSGKDGQSILLWDAKCDQSKTKMSTKQQLTRINQFIFMFVWLVEGYLIMGGKMIKGKVSFCKIGLKGSNSGVRFLIHDYSEIAKTINRIVGINTIYINLTFFTGIVEHISCLLMHVKQW